jgi:integrase
MRKMASIRRRGDAWQVRVTRKGIKTSVKTFKSKTEAQAWARQEEHQADLQLGKGGIPAKELTFGDLLTRYNQCVTIHKRGAEQELIRSRLILRLDISKCKVSSMTAADVARYRDSRLTLVSADTVRREFNLLRHVWSVAKREWMLALSENPFTDVRLPAPSPARQRRLTEEEWERLAQGAKTTKCDYLFTLVSIAYHTGLRRSEILALERRDVDLERRYLTIRKSKSGHSRTVPLTVGAHETLTAWINRHTEAQLFNVTPNALRLAFDRLCNKLGIRDFRFHDLRHSFTSRLAEMGFSAVELMALTGHRQLHTLTRYVHMQNSVLQKKLARIEANY